MISMIELKLLMERRARERGAECREENEDEVKEEDDVTVNRFAHLLF